MTPLPRRAAALGTTAALALGLAGPAAAELTAAGTWQDFQDFYALADLDVTAESQSDANGTLTLTGVTLDDTVTEDGLDVTFRIPSMTFAEQPDGTVRVTLAPEGTALMVFTGEDGAPDTALTFALAMPDFAATVTEAGESLRYDYDAPRLAMTLEEATRGDEPAPIDVSVALEALTGTYETVPAAAEGAPRTVSGTASAGALRFEMEAEDMDTPEAQANGHSAAKVGIALQDVETTSTLSLPEGATMADTAAALAAGYAAEGRLAYGRADIALANQAPEGDADIVAGIDGGELNFALEQDALRYGALSEGVTLRVAGDAVPVPQVEISAARIGNEIAIPVTASEAPQPFSIASEIEDLSIDDALWQMLDPQEALPREPIDLTLNLSGNAVLDQGAFDEPATGAEGEDEGPIPGGLADLDIDFALSALGARITADGALTFDSEDLTTYPGMPAPTGTVEISAAGIDALIDALVKVGVIPEDQTSGARLMLGLFARADGAGGYAAEIEFGPGGAVTANGQRLR